MEFIKNDLFKKDVRTFVKLNITKRVKKFTSQNTYAPEFIAQRYIQCLELDLLPSKCVFMDYLNTMESGKFNPNLAAIACEFYGGIFYKQFEENSKEIFKLEDITYKLKASYNAMSYINPVFYDLSQFHEEILASFRQTTDRFASGKLDEEKIFRFHH